MGLKGNRRGPWKTPEDDSYHPKLEEEACAPEHSMTLKKGIVHSNSLEGYDNNPSPSKVPSIYSKNLPPASVFSNKADKSRSNQVSSTSPNLSRPRVKVQKK